MPTLSNTNNKQKLFGWSLVAIRRLDGEAFDGVEMPRRDLHFMISWPSGPLGTDTEVILELMHPVTSQRLTMSWNRL